MDLTNLSQSEVATYMNRDRTTIRQWQQQGMPYKKGKRGQASRYVMPVVLNWYCGHIYAKKVGLSLSPLETTLLGHAFGMAEFDPAEWPKYAKLLAKDAGATDAEFREAFGFVRGLMAERLR